jgi:hypothetical protein
MEREAIRSGRARAEVGRNQFVGSRTMPSTCARAAVAASGVEKLVDSGASVGFYRHRLVAKKSSLAFAACRLNVIGLLA